MVAIFIFNILLLLLYAFSLSIVGLDYYREKKPILLALMVFFSFFILDNVIIYMTEFIESFAHFYDQLFMVVPIIKAGIYLVNNYCCFWIVNLISQRSFKKSQWAILIGMGLWMLMTPLFPASAMQVWLFYLPNQLFLIYVGVSAWRAFKQNSISPTAAYYLKWIAVLCVVSGICILAEDTFVIFNVDQYSSLKVKIFNRNFCEDLFSIAACLLGLRYSLKQFFSNKTEALPEEKTLRDEESLLAFSQHYQFTQRETEIFQLLLAEKSNQEIADTLFLSIGTVKTHVHNIFIKLEINRRNQIPSLYQNFLQGA